MADLVGHLSRRSVVLQARDYRAFLGRPAEEDAPPEGIDEYCRLLSQLGRLVTTATRHGLRAP
jgi:hypothetical protein